MLPWTSAPDIFTHCTSFHSSGFHLRDVKQMRENLKSARRAKGMTQQAMADYLGITLRHYQKVEYEEIKGSFEIWDALEDLLGVHQQILRISSNSRPDKEESL